MRPFQHMDTKFIYLGWTLFLLVSYYFISGSSLPTYYQIWEGFKEMWNQGLVYHILNSLKLFFISLTISVILSSLIAYLSSIPLFKFFGIFISKLRFLPLTGITFYLSLAFNEARDIQIWVLVIFMSTYLTTSLLSILYDNITSDLSHSFTLGNSSWKTLYEVIILGRLDYVVDSVRQNLAIVWMMIVTVESLLPSEGGIGFLIRTSEKFMNHGRIIALQVVILLIGILLDSLIKRSIKVFFPYSSLK